VDAAGNLIGINTAIFSKTGGSQAIGFAIPTKLALEVMQSIIEHAHVIRGWVGVEVKALTPELAESLGLGETAGFVVAGVYRDGPAAGGGLRAGVVFLSIDKQVSSDGP
ncbi:Do family serine endopeptidase AlgW, partial [Pseudomonas aeruginosa]